MEPIVVRKMDFPYSGAMERIFIREDPELSYTFLGSWMLLPYLEPYLIRSVHQAMERVPDARLREEMRRFCAQEGQHYKEHAKANEVVRQMLPGFAKLRPIEDGIAREYRRFTEEKSLRFNLAYAEGFESITTANAITQMELRIFDDMTGPLKDLMLWHVMEELEHRTVAFEAYEALFGGPGGYLYRLVAGTWAQWHFVRSTMRLARCMMEADPESLRKLDTPAIRTRRDAHRKRYLYLVLPRVLRIYAPWYSPRKVALPEVYGEIRDHYTRAALDTA